MVVVDGRPSVLPGPAALVNDLEAVAGFDRANNDPMLGVAPVARHRDPSVVACFHPRTERSRASVDEWVNFLEIRCLPVVACANALFVDDADLGTIRPFADDDAMGLIVRVDGDVGRSTDHRRSVAEGPLRGLCAHSFIAPGDSVWTRRNPRRGVFWPTH